MSCFGKKINEMKKKLCIGDPIVVRKKKSPKRLENFHGYSASKERHPKNVEDSFRKVYYDSVVAAIRKRFDQPDY